MFVQEISLSNFRCFRSAKLKLGKLTLLLGPNSSGKSTLLYSLLSAAQTRRFPLDFSPNGDLVQLGDYESIVFRHKSSLNVAVEFKLTDDDSDGLVSIGGTYSDSPLHMPRLKSAYFESPSFTFQIKGRLARWHLHRQRERSQTSESLDENFGQIVASISQLVQSIENRPRKKGQNVPARRKLSATRQGQKSGQLTLAKPEEYFRRSMVRAAGDPVLANHFLSVNSTLGLLREKLSYIGSFRHTPERTYYQSAQKTSKVGSFGEHYIDQLAEWEHSNAQEFRDLIKHLRAIQLLADMRVRRLSGGRFEIVVKPSPKGVGSSLADVGFGISQFLPILVADLQLGRRSTLAVSQPEIHLHPSVQAATANYFVDQATQNDKRYILETHSEYIVNRIRLLVVEGKIKPEDVSAVYLQRNGLGVDLHDIQFTSDGQILGAPEEYFATYMTDVMDIAFKA